MAPLSKQRQSEIKDIFYNASKNWSDKTIQNAYLEKVKSVTTAEIEDYLLINTHEEDHHYFKRMKQELASRKERITLFKWVIGILIAILSAILSVKK